MSITRCQSASVRLWIRPFGASTPALLTSTSRRPNRSIGAGDNRLDLRHVRDVGDDGLDVGRRAAPSLSMVACSDCSLTSLATTSVCGSPASWPVIAAPSTPPAPRMAMTRRPLLLLVAVSLLIRVRTRRRR